MKKLTITNKQGNKLLSFKADDVGVANYLRRAMYNTQGTYFTVCFTKKDGTERKLNGRTKATATLKGGNNTTAHIAKYVTVKEQGKDYRNINSETITELKACGLIFKVEKVA